MAGNTALVCTTAYTGVGKRLHTPPSHPVLGEPQGFSCNANNNNKQTISCFSLFVHFVVIVVIVAVVVVVVVVAVVVVVLLLLLLSVHFVHLGVEGGCLFV